jgi:hypothetical protein
MTESIPLLVCGSLGLLALLWVLLRARGSEGMPFLVYTGFYLLTTVIGATLFRYDPRLVQVLLTGRGIDLRGVPEVDPWLYWGLLFLPFVLAAVALRYVRGGRQGPPDFLPPPAPAPSMAGYLVVLFGLLGFCVVTMLSEGYTPLPSSLADVAGNYFRAIVQRIEMMEALGSAFFGVVYMGLPTLAYVGLHTTVRTRRPGWAMLTGVTVAATAWFSVVSVQRSIVLVFLIFFGIGTLLLGVIRGRLLVAFGGVLFALLTLMQVFIAGAFGAAQSLAQLVLRIGPAYPYYLGLFPNVYPFYGPDWQGTLFGREFTGRAPDYNLVVNDAIYADHRFQGASPIGAIPSAYAEGGLPYALLMGVVVAVTLVAISRFGRRAMGGAFRFAFYLQLLTMSYYLTQVPLGATIWQSYGIKWGILVLVLLWALDYGLFQPGEVSGQPGASPPVRGPRNANG